MKGPGCEGLRDGLGPSPRRHQGQWRPSPILLGAAPVMCDHRESAVSRPPPTTRGGGKLVELRHVAVVRRNSGCSGRSRMKCPFVDLVEAMGEMCRVECRTVRGLDADGVGEVSAGCASPRAPPALTSWVDRSERFRNRTIAKPAIAVSTPKVTRLGTNIASCLASYMLRLGSEIRRPSGRIPAMPCLPWSPPRVAAPRGSCWCARSVWLHVRCH